MQRTVEIYVNPVADGWSPFDTFLGGTEEYVVETATVLAALGYKVRVYHNGGHGEFRGVAYLPHELYHGTDIVLAVKKRPPHLGQRNIFFTNDISHRASDFQDFNAIIAVSNFHADNFLGREKVKVIYHACWPEKYLNPIKEPRSCLFSSSPDRGLRFLLEIWPEVHEKTQAVLTITYGAKTHPFGAKANIPGIVATDKISSDEMDALYRKSQFWLHPGIGVELFCISGYKAQAARCIPFFVPLMALQETIQYGIRTDWDHFKDELIEVLLAPPPFPPAPIHSWEKVTRELAGLF